MNKNTVTLTRWELSTLKGFIQSSIIDLESEFDDLSDYGKETWALFKAFQTKIK